MIFYNILMEAGHIIWENETKKEIFDINLTKI